jgi:hypothetical protein
MAAQSVVEDREGWGGPRTTRGKSSGRGRSWLAGLWPARLPWVVFLGMSWGTLVMCPRDMASSKIKKNRATSYLSHSYQLHCIAHPSIAYARALLAPVSTRAPSMSAYAQASSVATSRVHTSSTGHAVPPAHGEGDRCRLQHGGQMPSQRPGRPSPPRAELGAAGCRARPYVAHGSPWVACPRTSRAPPTQFTMAKAELARVQSATAGKELHTSMRFHSSKQQRRCCAKTACC